jgi:hypothetical protein
MSILCALFGHKPRVNDYRGSGYMKVDPHVVDGLDVEHAWLYASCPRCGEEYMAGSIHLPARLREQWLEHALEDTKKKLAEVTGAA